MTKIILAAVALTFGTLPIAAQNARSNTALTKVKAEVKQPAAKYWMSRDLSHLFGMMQVKA